MHEIYGLLMADKAIEMEFPDKSSTEVFRVSLYRYKKAKEKQLISIGMIDAEDRQKLSFQVQSQLPPFPAFKATIKFTDKIVRRQYDIKILAEETEDVSR